MDAERATSGSAFDVTVQDDRGRSRTVRCTPDDTVGTVARLAATEMKVRYEPGGYASLATLDGVGLRPHQRMGLPANRTFELVIVGTTP